MTHEAMDEAQEKEALLRSSILIIPSTCRKAVFREARQMNASMSSKDIVSGSIDPDAIPYKFVIVHDKGLCENLVQAINIMDLHGWILVDVWGTETTSRALLKRESGGRQE